MTKPYQDEPVEPNPDAQDARERTGTGWFTTARLWTLGFSLGASALALALFPVAGSRYDPTLAVLTATLIAVLWYTCFTYEAVELSRKLAQDAHERARSSLSIRVDRILEVLRELPRLGRDEDNADALIRGTTLWTENDLQELERQARHMGSERADAASRIVANLRWMQERVEAVRQVDPAHGYRWARFPWDDWTAKADMSEEQLTRWL